MYKTLESATPGTSVALNDALEVLKFNADGLICAIAQQFDSGTVLMQAWMNLESIKKSLESGRVCYWSRSRNKFWFKGEESGHIQKLVELRIDCDGDSILLKVDQTGPACHTERQSCFYLKVSDQQLVVSSQ